MVEFVYDKNIFGMKFNIISGPLQDKAVEYINSILQINKQTLRRYMISDIDMAYLENLPARLNECRRKCGEMDLAGVEILELALFFSQYYPVESTVVEMKKIQAEFVADCASGTVAEAERKGNRKIADIINRY